MYMENKKEMAAKASILYYEKNKSQNEIAEEMGISRSYVSQLLSFARDVGIVKISINIDEYSLRMIKKEVEFKERFNKLKQIYIMSSESAEFTEREIGKFAAPYITEMINESDVIGVNLGISVEKTINNLESQKFLNTRNKKIVQIMGNFNSRTLVTGVHPNELASKVSAILNCECYYLNCSVIIEQPELRSALLKERSIKDVFSMWDKLDLVIMGIGVAGNRSKLFKMFSDDMVEQIKKSNVCCELNINFFNEKGEYVPLFDMHKISIPYEKLKKVRKKVVISYGGYKKDAILAALRGEMIDVLITDSITINAIEKSI